jgi:hypothetical protein
LATQFPGDFSTIREIAPSGAHSSRVTFLLTCAQPGAAGAVDKAQEARQ